MGYSAIRSALAKYRKDHISSLLGETAASWFLSGWGSISAMLSDFTSGDENKAVSANYANGRASDRIPAHMKLDYVCGMRREVRKQYVSGESGIYTDVTPFRHGVMSTHGANLFDDAMDQVLSRKGS